MPGGKVPSKPGLGGVLGNTLYLLGWLLQGRGKSAWVGGKITRAFKLQNTVGIFHEKIIIKITLAGGQSGRGGHYQQLDQAGKGITLAGGQSGRGGHYQKSY